MKGSKLLNTIIIDGGYIYIRIHHNINPDYNYITTTLLNPKQYYKDNKERLNKCNKKYYDKNRPNNVLIQGSKEDRMNKSCIVQGINIKDFDGFITEQKYCSLFNESFKQKIRNQYHNKCFLCGNEQNRKLSVHHVNYDKDCLCGSSCEFVPLCTSCHAKTNKNRQYWEDLIMCYLYPNRYFMVEV